MNSQIMVYRRKNKKEIPKITYPCSYPGCQIPAEFPAPKSKYKLDEYIYFCLEHIRDYNKNWDFYKNYSPDEMEFEIRADVTWRRPSWPMHMFHQKEQQIRQKIKEDYFSDIMAAKSKASLEKLVIKSLTVEEQKALHLFDLQIPTTLSEIKRIYRILVKKYHPDANNGSKESEEMIKLITRAYQVLRTLYQRDERIKK